MNSLHTIPRFAVPYGIGDCCTAVGAQLEWSPKSADAFRLLLGHRPMFWTSSGRQALWLMLRAMRLPAGAGVAVPLYCDGSMHTAIVAAGLEPVWVDVDQRTLTMDPDSLARVRHQVSAILAVHLFGHLADMDRILKVADGIPVIEDTAHAPLSFYDDRLAGTMGVGCLYSFASTKYWPAGGGGLVILNDGDLALRVARDAARLRPVGLFAELRNIMGQAAKSALFHRRVYGMFGHPLRRSAEPHALLEPCLNTKAILKGQAAVAVRHAEVFPERVELQRRNSLRLLWRLGTVEHTVLPREPQQCRYNYHMFPVLVANREERDAVAAAMLRRGVDTSRIYCDIVEQAEDLGYRGGCPVSESVADRILTLPNYASLAARDMDRVAAAFLESLAEVRRAREASAAQVQTRKKAAYA